MNGSNCNESDPCSYCPVENLHVKFVILVVITPLICIYGIFGSVCAVRIFLLPSMRSTQNLFLTALAVCDIGVLIGAIVLYSVEILYDYMGSLRLYRIWIAYLAPAFFAGQTSVSGAIAFTLAATVERWLDLKHKSMAQRLCQFAHALVWLVVLGFLVICFNVTRLMETAVIQHPNCTGIPRYEVVQSKLAKTRTYSLVYSVWLCNGLLVVLPVLVLLVLNVIIARHIIRQDKQTLQLARQHCKKMSFSAMSFKCAAAAWEFKRIQKRATARRKETSLVLTVVVSIFLICNVPDFVLTLIEHIHFKFLLQNGHFYSFSKDLINFLSVINSASNFTAYLTFSKDFRQHFREMMCTFGIKLWHALSCKCCLTANKLTPDHSVQPATSQAAGTADLELDLPKDDDSMFSKLFEDDGHSPMSSVVSPLQYTSSERRLPTSNGYSLFNGGGGGTTTTTKTDSISIWLESPGEVEEYV